MRAKQLSKRTGYVDVEVAEGVTKVRGDAKVVVKGRVEVPGQGGELLSTVYACLTLPVLI